MTLTPPRVYPNRGTYSLTVYDLRATESIKWLHRERATWQERSEIEALDEDHFVLVVRSEPGSRGLL
jgi:hypothetical protein